jgi:hypothetical protein
MMLALQIFACLVFYTLFLFALIATVILIQACVDHVRARRRDRHGAQRLDQRILEDEQVAQLDAMWELPTRPGRVA